MKKVFLFILFALIVGVSIFVSDLTPGSSSPAGGKEVKWVDFDVSYEALKEAMELDIKSYNKKTHVNWVDALAYLGAKYGGDFSNYKSEDLKAFAGRIQDGEELKDFTANMQHFSYYHEAYGAVLNGLIGLYKVEVPTDNGVVWKEKYGLKAFSPIPAGYWYTDSDDFGTSRSYGYSRRHFGHDLMTSTGTPLVAVESGTIEALGWNQYGGWRIGIRTLDHKRYYYYAHLRKDHPFAPYLYIGKSVTAGDVIGYSGQTGYSIKENTNNIETPHLHYGMQLIFNEKAKDSPNQLWIDMYALTRLLSANRAEVYQEGDEYQRKYRFSEEDYYLASGRVKDGTQAQVPVIMYHSLVKGGNSDYVIDPKVFEKDLKYLKKEGYTTILSSDLIRFVEDGVPLPEKPILLTFDDGSYNNLLYGLPLLEKYDMKALMSVVGSFADKAEQTGDNNPDYSYLNWKQIRDLYMSDHVEIGNHSYDSHDQNSPRKGMLQLPGESEKDYARYLKTDLGKMQKKLENVTGDPPVTFTYPFGAISEPSEKTIKKIGFQVSLSCYEGTNVITKGDSDCLYRLKRYLRPPDQTSEVFFRKITEEK